MTERRRGVLASAVTGDVPGKFWPSKEDGLIYEGAVNFAAGPSGVGKSTIVAAIAADVSRTVGPVIYGNLEDDLIIQSLRLDASGADMDKVLLDSFVLPRDFDALGQAIWEMQAKMVVFDTAEKHLDMPIQQWAKVLTPLWDMLSDLKCAALYVHHTNKNVRKNAGWQAALGGTTSGLGGTARAGALVGQRPDNNAQVVYCPVKDSYSETPLAIAFEFDKEEFDQSNGDTVEVSYMRIAEKNVTITDKVSLVHVTGDGDGKRGPNPEALAAAAEFLTLHLAAGARPVPDVYRCLTNSNSDVDTDKAVTDPEEWKSRKCGHIPYKIAEAAGESCPDCGGPVMEIPGLKSLAAGEDISWGTIKRARQALEIVSHKKGFGNKLINFCSLPDGHPSKAANAPDYLA